ncbi:MAG TPA: lamin tail domain-containing protein, partial [Longimicrobiaceae bacterium]|nr:lamin tail domain-containing protein [Longimicrobiaceae bacterium]
MPMPMALVLLALLLAACEPAPRSGAADPSERRYAASGVSADTLRSRIVVSEVMADPQVVPDGDGEWIELYNAGGAPAELRGWRLDSRADAGHAVARSLTVRPGEAVVLARNGSTAANGGVRAGYVYDGVALA